jgi:hypothetical protein
MRYCSCKCRKETFPCENKEVKVKGRFYSDGFNNFNNNPIIETSVVDIRNGYNIPISFSSDDTAIINKILSSNETDMCYIKGIIRPIQINAGLTCKIEAEIILNSADDFFYKNEINY